MYPVLVPGADSSRSRFAADQQSLRGAQSWTGDRCSVFTRRRHKAVCGCRAQLYSVSAVAGPIVREHAARTGPRSSLTWLPVAEAILQRFDLSDSS